MEFALQTAGTYDEVLAAARWAEQRNLAAFTLPDHYLRSASERKAAEVAAPDAFVQLAGVARETSSIELGVLVSPITFRHPAVLAKMAVTLDQMSSGRFTLGVGTGWMDREHEVFGIPYPPRAERFELLEEALAYLEAAFAESPTGYAGERFQLEDFPLSPRPIGELKMVVGGTGAVKTPTLAGRYAHEYNVYPDQPEAFAARIKIAHEAARAAGRDPERLMLSSSGAVVAGATRAEYDERLADFANTFETTPEELEKHFTARNTPRGTYDEVRGQLESFEELGVTRFYLQSVGPFDEARIAETLDALQS